MGRRAIVVQQKQTRGPLTSGAPRARGHHFFSSEYWDKLLGEIDLQSNLERAEISPSTESRMSFAAGLQQALRLRQNDVVSELKRGDSLEQVLNRYLLAVEKMSDTEMFTSVLLVSSDGKRLSHGAAPSLPRPYREAIDGAEIGPVAGSCGTAAFLGRPVYVTDIATDPLWANYRDVALPHGLRSCWSTPIRHADDHVMATFAIYHRNMTSPTRDELNAIAIITDHVAQAINWARNGQLEQI